MNQLSSLIQDLEQEWLQTPPGDGEEISFRQWLDLQGYGSLDEATERKTMGLTLIWSPSRSYLSAKLSCGHVETVSEFDNGWLHHPSEYELEQTLMARISHHNCRVAEERLAELEP
jgi:hypothetical protein